MGYSSKLRNSLSRREFFRQGDDYYRAFNLRGEEGETLLGPLPDGFVLNDDTNHRALQILAARRLEESCRSGIAEIHDKKERGSLRKGAFYLARIIYLKKQIKIDHLVANASPQTRKADVVRKLIDSLATIGKDSFDDARKVFKQGLDNYLKLEGGNEDAALKNTKFANQIDELAKPSLQ